MKYIVILKAFYHRLKFGLRYKNINLKEGLKLLFKNYAYDYWYKNEENNSK